VNAACRPRGAASTARAQSLRKLVMAAAAGCMHAVPVRMRRAAADSIDARPGVPDRGRGEC
jgi:hypothetical protein